MKRIREERGITLVALVITIIVMLILVAVTINIAIQGGLFETARYARDETQNAINEEKALGNGKVTIDNKTNVDIDDIVDGSYKNE